MRNDALTGQLDSLILATIAQQPGHGYAIVQRLAQPGGGRFALAEGTVYPALHRLEREGLLHSSWSADSDRPRRVYSVTGNGRSVFQARRRDWKRFSGAVQAGLG